jgi:hypothetical protein
MGIERRKDRRYPYRVKLFLVSGRTELLAQTEDVSFKGIFVRTDLPLPERHLLRLRLTLPPENDELILTGMVARSLPGRGDRPPGAGIQFYGASPADLERWNRFVRYVASGAPPPAPPPLPVPDAIHRKFPRHAATLRVVLGTVADLDHLYTQNVSKGGLFVGTTLDLALTTTLKVSVIHPRSGEPFTLDAVVRWRAGPPSPGLGLEFTGLDDRRREEFFDFIQGEIPVEQVTYVAHDDPRLVARGPRGPGDPEPLDDVEFDEDA